MFVHLYVCPEKGLATCPGSKLVFHLKRAKDQAPGDPSDPEQEEAGMDEAQVDGKYMVLYVCQECQ